MKLHTLSLDDAHDTHVFHEVFSQSVTDHNHTFFDCQVQRSVTIASIAVLDRTLDQTRYILLMIDTKSRAFKYVDLPSDHISEMKMKLYGHTIFIGAVKHSKRLVVLQFDVLSIMATTTGEPPSPIAEYELAGAFEWSPVFDYRFSSEPTVHRSMSCPVAVQKTASAASPSGRHHISVYHIPLKPDPRIETISPSTLLPMTRHSSSTEFCLGETGFRAVWLERWWDDDEYHFAKATFGPLGGSTMDSSRASVDPLWPAHAAIPFLPSSCVAIYFEESTGRTCLSLETEDVYVVEF